MVVPVGRTDELVVAAVVLVLAKLGLQMDFMGPKRYQSYITEEQERWKMVVER
ncbi:hypothetical protein D3C87_1036380 [compost metagenome]